MEKKTEVVTVTVTVQELTVMANTSTIPDGSTATKEVGLRRKVHSKNFVTDILCPRLLALMPTENLSPVDVIYRNMTWATVSDTIVITLVVLNTVMVITVMSKAP